MKMIEELCPYYKITCFNHETLLVLRLLCSTGNNLLASSKLIQYSTELYIAEIADMQLLTEKLKTTHHHVGCFSVHLSQKGFFGYGTYYAELG